MTGPRARQLAAIVVACLSVTAELHADYKATFMQAIRSFRLKQYAEAERLLRDALSEQPRETGERVQMSGLDYEPYVPKYYLGRIRYVAGDCAGALAAWRDSEADGAVQRSRVGRELERDRSDCERRLAAATTGSTGSSSVPRIAAASIPPSSAPPISMASASSSTPIPEVPSSVPPPSSAPASVPLLAASSSATVISTPPVTSSIPRRGPPAALLAAATFYFRAQYGETASALANARFDRTADTVQAELFLAASAYARFVTGGERDQRLREEAARHVRECRRLDPAFRPDTGYFSPRFIEFYRAAR